MKLSIIMPVYNGAFYIDKTISYILQSNSNEIELLLINDGSTDNSLGICEKYAKKDKRVKVINKENGGIVDTRNTGVVNANGEYLAFVDQDDYIELEIVMRILHSHKEDVVIFSTVRDYGGKYESCDTVHKAMLYKSKKEIFDNCIWPMVYPAATNGNVSHYGHVWQGLYKRNVLINEKITFKKYMSIEDDFLFLLEFFLKSNTVALVTDVGYRWVFNTQSTTYKKEYIEDMENKCEKYYSYKKELLSESEFFDPIYQELYHQKTRQVLGVKLVINEGNSNDFSYSLKLIENYMTKNGKYYNGDYLGHGNSRKSVKTIFYLLRSNAVLFALLLQKIILYTHKIKYWISR